MDDLQPLAWRRYQDGQPAYFADCESGRYLIEKRRGTGNRPGKVWTIKLDGAYVDVASSESEAQRKVIADRASRRLQTVNGS